jgi:NADH:ubiquinone oxidoreductase subunit 4 (subunit M)
MYLAIIILPLLGSIVSGFFGRKIGVSGAQMITCTAVVTTTILAVLAFFEVGLNNIPVSIEIFRWIDSESLNVSWGLHFDSLTVSMLIPVLIVSSLVHIYSIGYMSIDPHNQRFFSYLSLFTTMMVILVTAHNYLLMFVGWEGVGVCSYLLVCFWFTRIAANQSSISAFLTNRVGDCFLTIGMFAILWGFGNLDYATVFSLAPYMNENLVTIVGICILIGAMAKSSQVGLHLWLPMAMEGPTPVSALIHAATMVTAGVYLLMRSSPLIEYSSIVLMLCLWLGAITTVFSSLIGLFQQDIKKVIAYSTMSQLARKYITHSSIFRHQTICVEAIRKNTIANSQITKARDYLYNNHCNLKFLNSSTIIRLHLYIICGLIRSEFEVISKLVGISEAIRLILVFIKLKLINLIAKPFILKQQNFKTKTVFSPHLKKSNRNSLIFSRNMSTSINTKSLDSKNTDSEDLAFRQWLAGIIDGDGYFLLSKNGYNSCEITMDTRDKKVLYLIQHKYGGSVKQISNAYAFKYKLRNRAGLIELINDVNGFIRNPTRLLQMNKLCGKFNIELKYANNLTFNDGWLAGFIDSDGSIYYSESSGQVFIGISQKNKYLLEPLIHIYGGRVDISSPKIEAFKYVVYRKAELFNLIDNYFSKYPLRTEKMKRVNLIKQFYLVRLSKKNDDVVKFNEWVKFKDKWEKYLD